MEFLSGYAAARAPHAAYQVQPHPPPSPRSKGPARANSTSGTRTSSTNKRRSRIPGHGHARTSSAGTSSSRSDGHSLLHNVSWPQAPSPAGLDAGGAGIVDGAPVIVTSDSAGHAGPRDSDRERMSAPVNYYQDKQLPATPRLNTQAAAASASEPASASASASATSSATFGNPATAGAGFSDRRMLQLQLAAMYPELSLSAKVPGSAGLPRAESMSSVSAHTTASNRTMPSTEQHQSEAPAYHHRPFIVRNGRTYFSDPTIAYPLPVDLEEIHRQTLKTMLLMQLHGRPICSPRFANKPPSRILEVGCGSGFWSMMCYRYYEARGQHANMSFTGMDIVPFPPTSGGPKVPPSSAASAEADTRPDKDMNWHYVHHDIRKQPFPFPDSSFDFVMVKDMGLASPLNIQQGLIDEYIRILEPGGTVEIWETDHTIRMLRPHVPDSASTVIPAPTPIPTFNAEDHRSSDHNNTNNNNSSNNNSETDQQQQHPNNKPGGGCPATEVGAAYLMTPGTPLSTPTNMYLVEYNGWVAKALEQRLLFAMPCTAMESVLVQEAELLKEVGSRRLAVPLSEVRWEREGVGGVVTKDGKSYIETGKAKQRLASGASSTNSGSSGSGAGGGGGGGPSLDPAAAALRHTALMTVVGEIQSLDHILREVSGKSQDEWDAWMGKMMNDLVRENGTSWGECLEVGAWWARKR